MQNFQALGAPPPDPSPPNTASPFIANFCLRAWIEPEYDALPAPLFVFLLRWLIYKWVIKVAIFGPILVQRRGFVKFFSTGVIADHIYQLFRFRRETPHSEDFSRSPDLNEKSPDITI